MGVGFHADDGALNVNVWLTPDWACRSGGGMEIFRCTPGRHASFKDFNLVLSRTAAAVRENAARAQGVDFVDYKQNRAVIFVSDRFHASRIGEFVNPDEAPRVNLTLIFGERADLHQLYRKT